MRKISKRRKRKIGNLVITSSLMAMLFSISTFAWFVGMRTVNVSSFNVEIASTESLLLSLDGKAWSTTVSISKDTLDDVSYAGHTNSWGGDGLVPLSTIGEMDSSISRMQFFGKTSLTALSGGYRLISSKLDNSGITEEDGYVAFDLFVKNHSGNQYFPNLNPLDEEAIYLADDSFIAVAAGGVSGTGIENSARVAFAQIGRVNAKTASETEITGITCEPDIDGKPSINGAVTGICREAQIWEPNDIDHEINALKWFNKSCKQRTGVNIYEKESYGDACPTLTDGVYYPTYAVAGKITSGDMVDVYDGAEFNGYTGTSSNLLQKFPYFTDTDKMREGNDRPEFMTLSPNSVTKVRIYIFIEGQDIDNYDLASIGKRISVKFGFTKERFIPEDIEYDGPKLDEVPPVITLRGNNPITLSVGEEYVELGATARDDMDGDITEKIIISGEVIVEQAGNYEVTYTVKDRSQNETVATRTVIVE